MFLPMPDLSESDAFACLGVRRPTVILHNHNVFAVGFTRPDAAREAVEAAALDLWVPVPTRDDATRFRLAWFAYTHPIWQGDPAMRRAVPGEDGAFPVMIWREADIDDAWVTEQDRVAARRTAVAA